MIAFYIFSLIFFLAEVKTDKCHVCDTTNEEFRAVWIATVENIDWPSSNTASPAEQQAELIRILNVVQLLNMNAVIFHVIIKHPICVFSHKRCFFLLINLGSSYW